MDDLFQVPISTPDAISQSLRSGRRQLSRIFPRLKDSVPINTGAEAVGHATLNTSTTARRRGAQPALPAHDNDEDAIIAASRALDDECPDGGYG
ncbi:hypothetical protein G3M48_006599 [Beauveria asiatica]|uniref:Uncharacterized protein n=1 Tax=Beauveria asiatica TaxID=1069075 RepID=A0AAW0S5L1_9HYPO